MAKLPDHIDIRVDHKFYEQVRKAAWDEGMNISVWVRKVIQDKIDAIKALLRQKKE